MATRVRARIALIPLTLCLAVCVAGADACRRAAANEADDQPDATVEGKRITFPQNSPKLAALVSSPVGTDSVSSAPLNGHLAWNEDVTVRVFSPFGGRVVKVVTDAGQHAAPGQTLALIAAPDFGQAQADARRAATDLSIAERALTRQRDLAAHGLVAQKDVEQADADVARARAEQQRATGRLAMYGGDTATIDQVFPLKAPIGGEIVERNVSAGQEVRPDQMLANAPQLFAPLFVITDPARLWVILDVPEQDLSLLRAGTPLTIHAPAWPNRVFHGEVTLLGGALDPSTRTLKVRGAVDDNEGLLKAEMLVTVDVQRPRAASAAVPTSAVLLDGDAHVVFVEERPGHYQRREVRVGTEHAGMVPVLDGLKVGDRVVTGSALLLEQVYRSGRAGG